MDDKPFETINVIPLVDIMLVLLAIVLTTASFISTGRIPVALPQVSKSDVEKSRDAIIEVVASGAMYFNGREASRELLEAQLRTLPVDTRVLVRADRELRLQTFIDVADMLKRLKITRVSVQTQSTTR